MEAPGREEFSRFASETGAIGVKEQGRALYWKRERFLDTLNN